MISVTVCLCGCGHFSIHEAEFEGIEVEPTCKSCGSNDVDWMTVNSDDLEEDLENAQETLAELI